jgi:hypothetical protein
LSLNIGGYTSDGLVLEAGFVATGFVSANR